MTTFQRIRGSHVFYALLFLVFFAVPLAGGNFLLSIAVQTTVFISLAVAYDVVVGRVGALSLGQPLFFGLGAYIAALVGINFDPGVWVELLIAGVAAATMAVVIGIPAFRLSLHSFAIGTLGFLLIGLLVAMNWIDVTRGPLCLTAVPPLRIDYPGGEFVARSLSDHYWVGGALAGLIVLAVYLLSRSRIGLLFTAVRDDPVLASSRGVWPTGIRIGAFTLSGVMTAFAGVFFAHWIGVVCPNQFDLPLMQLLLVIVFIGGRGSLRGVVIGAILFTVLPQFLRVADEWRLVIFGALLLVVVQYFPDGLEGIMRRVEKALVPFARRWRRRDRQPRQR